MYDKLNGYHYKTAFEVPHTIMAILAELIVDACFHS